LGEPEMLAHNLYRFSYSLVFYLITTLKNLSPHPSELKILLRREQECIKQGYGARTYVALAPALENSWASLWAPFQPKKSKLCLQSQELKPFYEKALEPLLKKAPVSPELCF